jgi:hypothetical protein
MVHICILISAYSWQASNVLRIHGAWIRMDTVSSSLDTERRGVGRNSLIKRVDEFDRLPRPW